jgi:hypothetical protein
MRGEGVVAGTGARVNYSLRAAKGAERYILAELVSTAMGLHESTRYSYIGMGSFYFRDFLLMESRFNWSQMTSAELETSHVPRCVFNCPSDRIKVHEGDVGDIVKAKARGETSVTWLDFDQRLDANFLSIMEEYSTRCGPGSLLFVTVNANYKDDVKPATFRRDFEKDTGIDPFSIDGVSAATFSGPKAATDISKIMAYFVADKVKGHFARGLDASFGVDHVASFEYSDGHTMLTLVFYFDHGRARKQYLKLCRKTSVSRFLREKPYSLRMPNLTLRERLYLQQRSRSLKRACASIGLDHKELVDFRHLDRFWPHFLEAEP